MKKLLPRVLLGVAGGVAVYVAFTIWADARQVGEALSHYAWSSAVLALLLAAANYLVRFIRWQLYLRVLRLDVPVGESLLVFLGGFALTVTPGKLGEAIKALLLRESRGIPAARTAPIVIAERLTDLVGLLSLAAFGAFTFDVDRRFLIAGTALVAIALLFVMVRPLAELALAIAARMPVLGKMSPKLREAYESTAIMMLPGTFLLSVLLSAVAWFFECMAFWLIVTGFEGATIALHPATFIYSTMTVAGALSFLPGGLGVTEAGMLFMLTNMATGVTRGTAAAATFITRVCTLWFAVVVGLAALALFARRTNVKITLPTPENASPLPEMP
jgi:glycosyltransferase 2 family protein